jgi:hypothetical protein
MTTPPRDPDWYSDPSGKPGLMYWDGQQWHTEIPATSSPADRPPAQPISTAPRARRQTAVITALLVAVVVLFGIVGITSYLLLKQSRPSQTSTAQPTPPSAQTSQPASSSSAASMFQYFETSWGTSCQVTAERVTCQTCVPGHVITNAYTCDDPVPEVAVNTGGIVDRNPGDIGSSSDTQQLSNGETYYVNGWTIVPRGGWVRFISDTTGHGMAVAGQNFDSF